MKHIKLFETFDKYYENMIREVFQSVIDDNLIESWGGDAIMGANGLYYSIGHWEGTKGSYASGPTTKYEDRNKTIIKEVDIVFYCLKNGSMCPSPVLNSMDVTSEVERLKSMGYTTKCETLWFYTGKDVFYIKVIINI